MKLYAGPRRSFKVSGFFLAKKGCLRKRPRLDTRGLAVKSSRLTRPHRLVAQDVGFSVRKPGFDSPWGYSFSAFFSRPVCIRRPDG
jgi:hypothetical protein